MIRPLLTILLTVWGFLYEKLSKLEHHVQHSITVCIAQELKGHKISEEFECSLLQIPVGTAKQQWKELVPQRHGLSDAVIKLSAEHISHKSLLLGVINHAI